MFARSVAFAVLLALILGGCNENSAPASGGNVPAVKLQRAFPGLSFQQPVAMVQAPGDNTHGFVVEQAGRVMAFANTPDAVSSYTFIDIHERVRSGGEKGLLGIAFHPRYAGNGWVFLSYTGSDKEGELYSYISRFTLTADGNRLDPASEKVILSLAQPYGNHNGGNIAFGPDGYLYVGFGDGGAGGDPHGNGQNTDTLLGAILRIDVDGGEPYAIPPDNPFAQGGGRGEIYAWGLRNPWRWSFDARTGELWVGDVGQSKWEEIDRVEKGRNYGWNIREGAHCYNTEYCETSDLIEPVAEYSHEQGQAVTGGFVYRGNAVAALQGVYVYGDFASGKVWGLIRQGDRYRSALLTASGLNIASFAIDNAGEVYAVDYAGGGIYRLVAP